ncbi:MAG: lamin tail domain-containing protein [Deltaproteobacteria bacterium]|nr:lamin tail domain-containing protein [Deltaproteobacteria bacterium]
MNWEQAKERGVQVLALAPLALLVAALTCPATDLEPPWGDAAAEGSGPDGDAGAAPAGEAETDGAAGELGAEDAPPGPPALVPSGCAAPEVSMGDLCVILGTYSAVVRWELDRAAFAAVGCTAPGGAAGAEAGGALDAHRLVVAPLAPGLPYDCAIDAWTDAGRVRLAVFGLLTSAGEPWVVITEVLGNPAGAEPTQEFVELANLGDLPVDLTGWALEDESGGPFLPDGTELDPGDVVLFVSDEYDPSGAGDPAADPGARIVRVGRALGTMGLRNSGEAVYLVAPDGDTVSSYPNTRGELPDGVSAVRSPASSPEIDEDAWGESGEGGATPGRI